MITEKLHIYLVLVIATLMTVACSGPKELSQLTKSDNFIEEPVSPYYTNPRSDLVFSFKISKTSMSDSLDIILDSMLLESIEFEDYGFTVGMNRIDSSTIEMVERSMQISVPLNVIIYKNTMLGTLTASGKLKLDFDSDLDIDRNWNLITFTSLDNYEWIEKPKFNAGFITVPITKMTSSNSPINARHGAAVTTTSARHQCSQCCI